MLRLGTCWCAGLALLLPAPWAWLYGAFAAIGAAAWVTAPRDEPAPDPDASSENPDR
jgi:hypothetical protein